jgi:hypothetical protein
VVQAAGLNEEIPMTRRKLFSTLAGAPLALLSGIDDEMDDHEFRATLVAAVVEINKAWSQKVRCKNAIRTI